MASTKPDTAPSAERVAYRDAGEFNKAMDRAADAIRAAEGPDIAGTVIWAALVGFQAFLYVTDWVFDWEVREKIIPGVDLAKPLWVLIVGMILFHHAWARYQHGRILRTACVCGAAQSCSRSRSTRAAAARAPSAGARSTSASTGGLTRTEAAASRVI